MTRANAIAAPRRKCTRSTRSPSGECRGERTYSERATLLRPLLLLLLFVSPDHLPLLLTQVEGKVHRRLLPRPLRPILGRDGDRLHHWLLPWQHLAVRSYICIASASSFTTTIVQRAGDRPHLEAHAMLPRSLSLPPSFPPSMQDLVRQRLQRPELPHRRFRTWKMHTTRTLVPERSLRQEDDCLPAPQGRSPLRSRKRLRQQQPDGWVQSP